MKVMMLVMCAMCLASLKVNAIETGYTYKDIQILKQTEPKVAKAFLKGVAFTAYVFRVIDTGQYMYCPPRMTVIDIQLIELLVNTEIRIHNASVDDWYHELVRKGLERTYPCDK
jgi:hypothetical protein